ncbi:S-protein homolog 8-like [Malania oleifera]|uniref:S-protein homolog 8-like n=1 Tax=Malania oleifera TaxID=397392 RepID=UPI0025AE5512|nr:S-protein homolog 8-like [Malania oleifera]
MNRQVLCAALFLALVGVSSAASAAPRSRKQYLSFTNNLQNKVLDVNCKNLNPYIDLGLHILLPNEKYEFSYDANRTMLYSCHLRHGDTTTVFPVSDSATKRACGRNHCDYKAEDNGISLLNHKNKQFTLKYLWGQKYSNMHFG